MFRSRVSRLAHAFLGLVWCGTVAARPVALPCPMGGHGREHAHVATAQPPSSHASVAAHGHHHVAAVQVESGPTDAAPAVPAPAAPAHSCDCLAHCCASAVAAPAQFAQTIATAERHNDSAPLRAQSEHVAAWVDFVLPYAIAPPSLVVG
jgi:hypothetical protein